MLRSHCNALCPSVWPRSSDGQSSGFLNRVSRVRLTPGPPPASPSDAAKYAPPLEVIPRGGASA